MNAPVLIPDEGEGLVGLRGAHPCMIELHDAIRRAAALDAAVVVWGPTGSGKRSEEHTSELQSQSNLVCRLLLEKKNRYITNVSSCKQGSAILTDRARPSAAGCAM